MLLLDLIVLTECSSGMASDLPLAIELLWNRPAEPPLVANVPPDRIRVRWTTLVSSDLDVIDFVDQHCRAWNRHAEKVGEQDSGGRRTAEFVCKG